MTANPQLLPLFARLFLGAVTIGHLLQTEQHAAVQASPMSPITLEHILDKWRQRARETKTVKVVLEVENTNYYGPPEYWLPEFSANPPPQVEYGEIEPYVTHQRVLYRFDTERARISFFDSDTGKLESEMAFDGKVVTTLTSEVEDRGDVYPYGTLGKEDGFLRRTYTSTKPPIWHYRMLSPTLNGLDLANCELSGRSAAIDNINCVVLVERPPEGRRVMREDEYWIAPDLGCAVMRYVEKHLGEIHSQLDIVYSQIDGRLQPSSWKMIRMDPIGRLEEERNYRVIELQRNLQIPDSDFSIQFPVGAVVRDFDADQSFILRAEGERRIITKEEQTATYSQARNSESGEALKPKSQRWIYLLVGTGVLLVVGALCVFVWRRRSR